MKKLLKTITIKQEMVSVHIKWMIFSLFVFSVNTSFAQFQSNEPLYISDNGYVYIGSDNYYFGGGNGQTITSRTTSTYGKLIFAYPAAAINALDAHYLDGYGSVITTEPFTFPVGQKGVYAPAKVKPSTKTAIDAAYYRASPLTIGATSGGSATYWSSSQKGSLNFTDFTNFAKGISSAWLQFFYTAASVEGTQTDLGIGNTRRVRAIRTF